MHITRDRSVFRDTSMRRSAERRTLSRRAVSVRGRPTETEQLSDRAD